MAITYKLAAKMDKAGRSQGDKEKQPFLETTQSPPANDSALQVGGNRRILVVDDNEVVLKAFELKLKASGFIVSTTTECGEAASMAEQTGAELIILDVNFTRGTGSMEWNGFSVMQWFRRFSELAHLPVIIVTGADSSKAKEKAFQEGAVAFFEKPVNYTELLAAIQNALGNNAEHGE